MLKRQEITANFSGDVIVRCALVDTRCLHEAGSRFPDGKQGKFDRNAIVLNRSS